MVLPFLLTLSQVKCAVVLHPSIQLESFVFGGDTAALLKSVPCPFFMAPAGNDLPTWAEAGEFGQALRASAKGGECVFKARLPRDAHTLLASSIPGDNL